MKNKKILITGSSGFIGQRLVKALDDELILLSRKKNNIHKTIICDFLKQEIPDSSLNGVHTVFHLAGYAHDNRSGEKIENIYQFINVKVTEKLAKLSMLV